MNNNFNNPPTTPSVAENPPIAPSGYPEIALLLPAAWPGVTTSKTEIMAKKLFEKIKGGEIKAESLDTRKKIEEAIASAKVIPRGEIYKEVSADGIIAIFERNGWIKKIPPPKVIEPPKIPEHIKMEVPEIKADFKFVEDEVLNERVKKELLRKAENERHYQLIMENKKLVDKVYPRCLEILKTGIDPAEKYVEAGLYTPEETGIHATEVRDAQKKFEEQNTKTDLEAKKLATIFEAIFIETVNLSECLGEGVVARPSNMHDDIFDPKIDSYVILNDMTLGIDVSTRDIQGPNYADKVKRNLIKIGRGNMYGIKYYKDAAGELDKNIFAPKVIVSCDTAMIKGLMTDFDALSKEDFAKRLRTSDIAESIVSQILGQCRIYAEFAEENNKGIMAEYYRNIEKNMQSISDRSPVLRNLMAGVGSDPVTKKIAAIAMELKGKGAGHIDEYKEDEVEEMAA